MNSAFEATAVQSASAAACPPLRLLLLPVLVLLLSVASVRLVSPARAAELVGCYAHAVSGGRSLLFLQTDLTARFCEAQCGQRGFGWFALHAGSQCWCHDAVDHYGAAEAEAEAEGRCDQPCGGDRAALCGGERGDSVYSVDPSRLLAPPPVDPAAQPLLALVMIVKDEAHTLPSTLQSLRPYLDYYFVLDTGSTDGTPAVVRQVLGERGEVWEEPFIDYGWSRNRVLDIAQRSANPPVFALMLSADETVFNAYSLRRFCEQHRHSTGAEHEAYPIVMDTGDRFDSLRLSRTAKGWRYVGRVHEYLAAPGLEQHPTVRVPDTFIRFQASDLARRSERHHLTLALLQQEAQDGPANTRASFYLARSYAAVGNHTAALAEYRRRVELGGWREEVYESKYAIPALLAALGRPWPEQEHAYLQAYEHSPERAEPLYAIAAHYRDEQMPALAFLYASHAATLPYPAHAALWVDAAVYEWQCAHLVGMTAHRLGPSRHKEGYLALSKAAAARGADRETARQLQRYRRLLGDDEVRRLDSGGPGRAQELAISAAQHTQQPQPHGAEQQLAGPQVRPTVAGQERATEQVAVSTADAAETSVWLTCSFVVAAVLVVAAFAELSALLRRGKLFRRADKHLSDKVV